ncbi:MAG TPA: hypothetical protein VM432_08955 [Bdellovibrionales bacterium]|nr:hypothetical protein [Bdellovibrionales bacterium]
MVQSTITLLVFLASSISFASGSAMVHHQQELSPSAVYSGNSPIDLSHGLLFNNGTFGLPNTSIEEWAKAPVLFPNISEKNYAYEVRDERHRLVRSAKFLLEWGKAAIWNYEHVTADSRPEAIEHSKQAIATLEPGLQRLETAFDKLNGAGRSDWASAQEELRRAIVDFRLAYTQMHKNSRL